MASIMRTNSGKIQPQLIDYRIDFHCPDVLGDPGPEDFSLCIIGDILYYHDLDATSRIGYIKAYYIPVFSASENQLNQFDIFDAVSSELEACYEALFDYQTGDFKESVQEQFDYEIHNLDILFIDTIEILPEHRGRGLGLAVIRRLIERFGPFGGFVIGLPSPLNSSETADWVNKMEMWRFDQDRGRATRKLRTYYGRLGFEQVGGTDFIALCTTRQLPSLDELCPLLIS